MNVQHTEVILTAVGQVTLCIDKIGCVAYTGDVIRVCRSNSLICVKAVANCLAVTGLGGNGRLTFFAVEQTVLRVS